MEKIDFVVLWVDGNDPEWQSERAKYAPVAETGGNTEIRFRDWDMMRYWFRGVEKFAPWVNHVYFVTWGHYPEWLNLEHPKLTVIKHEEYIPKQYLPTFNSNVIELNLHRIPELSEKFVLFNDDMFLTDYVYEADFFRNGVPCETAILGQFSPVEWGPGPHSGVNNMTLINLHFSKREVLKKWYKKFFSIKYRKYILQNAILFASPYFSCFRDGHLPTSHIKKTFDEVWEKEGERLNHCCSSKFRSCADLTHWLLKYWNICSGHFFPRSINWGKLFILGRDNNWDTEIRMRKYKAVCLNDSESLDFSETQKTMRAAFTQILPEKSSFEL